VTGKHLTNRKCFYSRLCEMSFAYSIGKVMMETYVELMVCEVGMKPIA